MKAERVNELSAGKLNVDGGKIPCSESHREWEGAGQDSKCGVWDLFLAVQLSLPVTETPMPSSLQAF